MNRISEEFYSARSESSGPSDRDNQLLVLDFVELMSDDTDKLP